MRRPVRPLRRARTSSTRLADVAATLVECWEALARWVATHGREAPRLIVGALAEKAPDATSAVALVT